MNWFDCLYTFLKIIDSQSLIGAARALGTTNSVITKRLQWLEQKLGCTLFLRTTRKITLTEQGEWLLRKIKPLLDEWYDIKTQLTDNQEQLTGKITLAFPPNLSNVEAYNQLLHLFLKKNPLLSLEIKTLHAPVNLMDEKIDVVIGTEKYILDLNTTVAIPLTEISYYCYAAPEYLKTHPKIKTPIDLKKHNCLIYSQENQWQFNGKFYTVEGNFTADTGDAIISACVAGKGLAYIPDLLMRETLKEKHVSSVLTNYSSKKDYLKIFYTQHAYKPRKIIAIIKFFQELK